MSEDRTKLWSLKRSIAIGAIGFGLVSLFVFATVAYGERRMYENLGMLGAYFTWTVTFIVLSAAVFGTLVVGRWRLPRFYFLFGIAFFTYAVAWVIAYYNSPNTAGEVVGSLAGSVLMALVFALAFDSIESIVKLSAVLFVSNFLGYFIGSALNSSLGGQIGMLLWGVAYGLFFGAGIGAALHLVQRR